MVGGGRSDDVDAGRDNVKGQIKALEDKCRDDDEVVAGWT